MACRWSARSRRTQVGGHIGAAAVHVAHHRWLAGFHNRCHLDGGRLCWRNQYLAAARLAAVFRTDPHDAVDRTRRVRPRHADGYRHGVVIDQSITGQCAFNIAAAQPLVADEGDHCAGGDHQDSKRDDHPTPGCAGESGAPVPGLRRQDGIFGHMSAVAAGYRGSGVFGPGAR
jgi:hypothetical protein